MALVPALLVWSWPSPYVWGLVAVNAVMSTIAHLATVQAHKCADITVIDPMIFFRLVLAAFAGYVLYSEVPDIWTWGGSIVILIAGMILSRDERVQGARQRDGRPRSINRRRRGGKSPRLHAQNLDDRSHAGNRRLSPVL